MTKKGKSHANPGNTSTLAGFFRLLIPGLVLGLA